ncbi:hypothetical protein Moror_9371 [Moniliophthora roreri MCA 2997]|uniref:Protein kinase domain-containing protein n=1 Tax=Moniliophthora roreri (strain MCA 2997) TaxID=1381753 RepID=V2WGU3_MONRO|nr:hypothetical protein Moror_9371 [Moniliophthora roreri MCA 2997]
MAFIQGSSNFSIHGGQFSVIHGSQYNITHIHDNRVQVVRQERREPTIWDDFRRIRTGDVNIIEDVGESGVLWERDDENKWKVVARRIMSTARIYGSNADSGFLYARYSGPEAFKAFKRDFDKFSVIKHPNVTQLFGYNDNRHGLPALIFYDALIPLSRVLLRNWQTALRLYFRYQLGVAKFDDDADDDDDIDDDRFEPDEIWIEPRSGALRRGPFLQSNADLLDRLPGALSTSPLDPLSVSTYSDTSAVLDYLVRILPTNTILDEVSDQCWTYSEQLTAVKAWPYLASSLWKRNQQDIITQWTGLTKTLRHVCVSCSPPAMDKCKTVMEDGSVRFQFADQAKLGNYWELQYSLFHGSEPMNIPRSWLLQEQQAFCELPFGEKWKSSYHNSQLMGIGRAWLTQAHSVFSRLGIHEEKWGDYSVITDFELRFDRTEARTYQQKDTDTASNTPIPYLFIRRIPCPSDDEATWNSWAESMYFWSFDPSGREEVEESTRVSLGLPSLTTKVGFDCQSWSLDTYKVIEKIHLFKGFDPITTDYTRSLGYPLMQVVGDKHRFQELGGSNDDRSTSKDEEQMVVDCDSPTIESSKVTVGNKRKSKAADSSGKSRELDTDHSEDEDVTGSRSKCRRTATNVKNPVQVPKRGKWNNLPQRELSSRKCVEEARSGEWEGKVIESHVSFSLYDNHLLTEEEGRAY